MKKNGLIDGAFIATAALFITKILGLLYVIPFYKIIGEQGGALYSYAYNIYAIFLGISSAGIPSAINKIVSEYNALDKSEAKYRTLKISKTILSIISITAFLIMFIFAPGLAHTIIGDLDTVNTIEDVTFVIRTISLSLLIIPYLSATRGYYYGQRIIHVPSIASVLEQLFRIIVILLGSFLAYKVFNLSLRDTVAIALLGAFIGGLVSSIYLKVKTDRNKKALGIKSYEKRDDVQNKAIVKKIFEYSIPFIIINIATNLYAFVDMVLIMRGLGLIGFSGANIEFIQSAITTWSNKICVIISAFSIGMGTSLIPAIIANHTKGDIKSVEVNLKKALLLVISISLPAAIGLFVLAPEMWTLFYGYNEFGVAILRVSLISAFIANIYTLVQNTMIALNKFKLVYFSTFVGLIVNILLDIPMILILNSLGLKPYFGTIIATMTGYTISVIISTHNLKKTLNISLKSIFKPLVKVIYCNVIMLASLLLLKFIPISNLVLKIAIYAVVGVAVYFASMYFTKVIDELLGKDAIKRTLKKLKIIH